MFKIGKLEKVNNETIDIKIFTQEKIKHEKSNKNSETFKSLSFDISGDDYFLSFALNCQLEKLLDIPMNQTIDFSNYLLSGTYLTMQGITDFDIKTNINITRYLKNRYIIFLTFFTDYAFEDDPLYSGMCEFTFNLDDYLENNNSNI